MAPAPARWKRVAGGTSIGVWCRPAAPAVKPSWMGGDERADALETRAWERGLPATGELCLLTGAGLIGVRFRLAPPTASVDRDPVGWVLFITPAHDNSTYGDTAETFGAHIEMGEQPFVFQRSP